MHVRQQFDLSGKSALVTGGSRGLGLEIARGLGEAGARVLITARRQEWLDPALAELRADGLECAAVGCDVTQPEAVGNLVQAALGRFGAPDILVNAAGTSWGEPFEQVSLEHWRMVVETNLTGTFLVTQALGRGMIAGGGGKIINIASVAGLHGEPAEILQATAYAASKGGIIAMTRDLAVKWARHNIYVNAIAPGFFPTRMTRHVIETAGEQVRALSPFGRIGQEGEMKGVAVFLASAASNWITGQVLVVDGGASAW